MPLSSKRTDEICRYLQAFGMEATIEKFRLKESSVERYMRFNSLAPIKNAPKVLLLDIETSMLEAYLWHLGEQRIPPVNMTETWSMLTWLNHGKVMSGRVTPTEARYREDNSIIERIWKLLEEADIVCGHNVHRFDLRRLNTRFIKNGLPRPMPYQVIDTLKVAKKHFYVPSYKLDELCKFFEIPTKLPTVYQLWIDCVQGDETALKRMEKYNKNDVIILEDLFFKLQQWMDTPTNMNLYVETDKSICPQIGCGREIQEENWKGHYYTNTGKYKTFRCPSCNSIGRSRYSNLSKEENKKIVVGVVK